MGSIPDGAEQWWPMVNHGPLKKGACDCQDPMPYSPRSRHCKRCKRIILVKKPASTLAAQRAEE
jgi:hypothetical protein